MENPIADIVEIIICTGNIWRKSLLAVKDNEVANYRSLIVITRVVWLQLFVIIYKQHWHKSDPHSVQQVLDAYVNIWRSLAFIVY